MSSDSQCLYSTPIDISGTLRTSQQFSDSLNCALIYVAQEVAERLQRSDPFPAQIRFNSNNHPVKTIAIRAIKPESKLNLAVEHKSD